MQMPTADFGISPSLSRRPREAPRLRGGSDADTEGPTPRTHHARNGGCSAANPRRALCRLNARRDPPRPRLGRTSIDGRSSGASLVRDPQLWFDFVATSLLSELQARSRLRDRLRAVDRVWLLRRSAPTADQLPAEQLPPTRRFVVIVAAGAICSTIS